MATDLKATAVIREDAEGFHVDVVWSGAPLDRPCTEGYLLGRGKRRLAQRLKQAIDAQAVHLRPTITHDIYGKSYVTSSCRVMGKYANADLKRLGY
jgi:hypothetical protein